MTAVQQLITILEQQTKLYQQLLEIGVEKTKVLTLNDTTKLNDITRQEQKYVSALRTLDKQREEAAIAIVPAHEPLTVSSCLSYIDEPLRETVQQTADRLTEIVYQMKQQNERNQLLLLQSMQFVQLSMDLLMPSVEQLNYNNTSESKQPQRRTMFDSKA